MDNVRSLTPRYTIKFPGKMWEALDRAGFFDDAPQMAREIFRSAQKVSRGRGYVYAMTGSFGDLAAILDHLQFLADRIRTGHLTTRGLGVTLSDIDRQTHQRPIQAKETRRPFKGSAGQMSTTPHPHPRPPRPAGRGGTP